MKNNRFSILIAAIVLLLASLACRAITPLEEIPPTPTLSPDAATITNAHMSRDADDTYPTETYKYSDPTFYCFFDVNNASEGTVVKGTWVLLSAQGYSSQQVIDSAEITADTDGAYYFRLDRSGDAWPIGFYKIDLYIDGTLVESPGFEVK
jgi:hypothetical protein